MGHKSNWDGDWHLLPASVQIRQHSSSASASHKPLSVWAACEALAQLVRLQTLVERDRPAAPTIKVSGTESVASVAVANSLGMLLQLITN